MTRPPETCSVLVRPLERLLWRSGRPAVRSLEPGGEARGGLGPSSQGAAGFTASCAQHEEQKSHPAEPSRLRPLKGRCLLSEPGILTGTQSSRCSPEEGKGRCKDKTMNPQHRDSTVLSICHARSPSPLLGPCFEPPARRPSDSSLPSDSSPLSGQLCLPSALSWSHPFLGTLLSQGHKARSPMRLLVPLAFSDQHAAISGPGPRVHARLVWGELPPSQALGSGRRPCTPT